MLDLQVTGLASGFDWRPVVEQLTELERVPQRRLRAEQGQIGQRINAFNSIKTQLEVFNSRVDALQDLTLFDRRTSSPSDPGLATASAAAGTPLGNYDFEVLQVAGAASQRGTLNIGAGLSDSDDVSGVQVSSANFANPVNDGTFTVNGSIVTIEAGDSLQDLFDKIDDATGGDVTAEYDSATDRITLQSSGEIILGSATDTSNFLQAAKLHNNGSGTVSSASSLGTVRLGEALAGGSFETAITDGGAGEGLFRINGVDIAFDASTDSLSDVITRINNSDAEVIASYDTVNDRISLSNKTTGDVGIALEDVEGNFLEATGISGGTLQRGSNLLYTINGGGLMVSRSNTAGTDSHGISGLSVNVLQGPAEATLGGGDPIAAPSTVRDFGGGGGNSTRVRTDDPHGLSTGDPIKFTTTGTLPSPLAAETVYYARESGGSSLRIFNSASDALDNTNAIDFGSDPPYSGDVSVVAVSEPTVGASEDSTSFSINVGSDTESIKTAITDFIDEYNNVQSLIASQTAINTDPDGNVSGSTLSNDSLADEIASRLRTTVFSEITELEGTVRHLAALGFDTNGNDDSITLTDAGALDEALANDLTDVRRLFADENLGFAVQLADYLEATIGDEGVLAEKGERLGNQSSSIDEQIAAMERIVLSNQEQLVASFVAMERAQSQINSQLQFLTQSLPK